MTKIKSTKCALLVSGLALVVCISMLIGSTFAWFTDSVTSVGNIIQSGTLDVDLVDADDNSMEGQVIEFVTDDNRPQNEILWEPGCTYKTEPVFVVNNGNLALKYEITINGITGDAKLLEAIEWTVTVGNTVTSLSALKGNLLAGETTDAIVLSGHMKEEAGNEYQGLTVEGISISVYATQLTHENDSFNNQYDKDAGYDHGKRNIGPYSLNVLPDGVATYDGATKTYTIDVNSVAQGGWNASQGNYYAGYTVDVAGYGANASVKFTKENGTEVTWYLSDEERDGFIRNGEHQQWTAVGLKTAYHYDIDGDGVTDFTVVNDASAAKVEVADAEQLRKVIEQEGVSAILIADIDADADTTITVSADVTATLDLNRHTINFVTDEADKNGDGIFTSADNEVAIDVRGTLTVKNGTITTKHTDTDFGWSACTEVFYVAFNGTLNVENATIENLGGSSMAYAIDLVNATNVTLNIKNSTIKSTYIPVRVFNNGSGMNNVTIEDSTLDGVSRAFWVHIYSNTDNGDRGVKDATLNLDIFGNGNTFKASNTNRIIEFGFDDEINFDANGNQI